MGSTLNQSHSFKTTDSEVRIFLLRSQPLFAQLSRASLQDLAKLFHEVTYKEGSIVVAKDERIDSFFLIVGGQAEVLDDNKNTIAMLHPGETIGLSHTGLFSETGLRTANVIAKKDLLVLRIELNDFQVFVDSHPEIDLQHSSRMTLRLNFIKQIEPFAEINYSTALRIMDRITQIYVTENTEIFHQGDNADECYFLVHGNIEISIMQENGKDRSLVELTEPSVFGELGLLTKSKRNATAIARENSTLLVLGKKDFNELLKKGNVEEGELIRLLLDRQRFTQAENVTLHTRKTLEGNEIAILKNENEGDYQYVSTQALFVWNRLDGNHTLQDIALDFYKQYHQIAIDEISNLLIQFIQSGFINAPREKNYLNKKEMTSYEHVLSRVRRIMEAHIIFRNANAWLSRLYEKIGFIFYNKFSFLMMSLISIFGFVAFFIFTPQASKTLYMTPYAWLLIVLQSPLLLLIVPLHELAHALTTKYYGRQVRAFGVGWFWIGPMAFTDTSDMWLSERKPRLVVTLSGLFINIVIAGLFAMLAWVVPNATFALFLWMFALTNYLAAWANLDPLLELDGYYLLMDYFDKPNLRAHALVWFIEKKGFRKQYIPEIVYWMSCVAFVVVTALLTFAVQHLILNHVLPAQIGTFEVWHLQWILPILVILLSSLSLYSLIRRQRRLLNKSF